MHKRHHFSLPRYGILALDCCIYSHFLQSRPR
jgi:hypothetical protein